MDMNQPPFIRRNQVRKQAYEERMEAIATEIEQSKYSPLELFVRVSEEDQQKLREQLAFCIAGNNPQDFENLGRLCARIVAGSFQ
jgi:hypothetical protein